jgi:hypothetical protein
MSRGSGGASDDDEVSFRRREGERKGTDAASLHARSFLLSALANFDQKQRETGPVARVWLRLKGYKAGQCICPTNCVAIPVPLSFSGYIYIDFTSTGNVYPWVL